MSQQVSSILTTKSSGVCCRICQDSRSVENLLTPCKCAGTMGFVHSSCLEKWLSRTARTYCELCHHDFKTVVTAKSFREWLLSINGTLDLERRYLIIDTASLLLLTPLGVVSSWLCIQGASVYYNNNHFWTGFGLVLLTGFLMMMFAVWMIITFRYHYLSFRMWQQENTTVRLVFSNHQHQHHHQQNASTEINQLSNNIEQQKNNEQPTDEVVVSIVDGEGGGGPEDSQYYVGTNV